VPVAVGSGAVTALPLKASFSMKKRKIVLPVQSANLVEKMETIAAATAKYPLVNESDAVQAAVAKHTADFACGMCLTQQHHLCELETT
jgi:hypothetical protein